MNQQILFVSRDEHVILTRFCCETLRGAGYRTACAESLGRAVSVAFSLQPDLVILEQSYSEHERTAFIECLLESYPDIRVLYLQYGEAHPSLLLKACKDIFSGQHGCRSIYSIQEFIAKSA